MSIDLDLFGTTRVRLAGNTAVHVQADPQPTENPLTPNIRKLASLMLVKAADAFGNHGCNDYSIPNTTENVALLNEMEQWNVGPYRPPEQGYTYDPAVKDLYVPDWYLMRFLAYKLSQGIAG